jgi:hypothetical protein
MTRQLQTPYKELSTYGKYKITGATPTQMRDASRIEPPEMMVGRNQDSIEYMPRGDTHPT